MWFTSSDMLAQAMVGFGVIPSCNHSESVCTSKASLFLLTHEEEEERPGALLDHDLVGR